MLVYLLKVVDVVLILTTFSYQERSNHLSSNNQQQTSKTTSSQLEGTSKMLQRSEASEAKSSTDNLATIGNENLLRKRRMTW